MSDAERHRDGVAELAGAVMGLVRAIGRGQAKAVNPELVAVLELLAERGPMSPSDLADAIPAPRSSISRRLRTLAEAGLVGVEQDDSDARSYSAVLTERGHDHLQRLADEGLEVFAAMVTDWTDEEVRAYAAATRRLAAATPPPTASDLRRRPWWRGEP